MYICNIYIYHYHSIDNLEVCFKGPALSNSAADGFGYRDDVKTVRNAADVILTVLFGRYAGSKNYLATRRAHGSCIEVQLRSLMIANGFRHGSNQHVPGGR